MDEPSHYEILGVPVDADTTAIRSAWRTIAKAVHPDRHPDDPEALRRFLAAKEAHEALSDPTRRAEYDADRAAAVEAARVAAMHPRCTRCGSPAILGGSGPGSRPAGPYRCIRCAVMERAQSRSSPPASAPAPAPVTPKPKKQKRRDGPPASPRRPSRRSSPRSATAPQAHGRYSSTADSKAAPALSFGIGADVFGPRRIDELFLGSQGLSPNELLEVLLGEAAIRASLQAVDPDQERRGATVLSFSHDGRTIELRVDRAAAGEMSGTLRSVQRVMEALRKLF